MDETPLLAAVKLNGVAMDNHVEQAVELDVVLDLYLSAIREYFDALEARLQAAFSNGDLDSVREEWNRAISGFKDADHEKGM